MSGYVRSRDNREASDWQSSYILEVSKNWVDKKCVHKTFQKNAVLKMCGYEDEEAAPWETKKLWGN